MLKHMNAVAMNPKKLQQVINDPNYQKQEKFKGIRCFLIVSPEGSKLYTRGENYVEHNFPHLRDVKGPNCVLDGELYQVGKEDEVISGWANSKYLVGLIDVSGVTFQCFDILDANGIGLTKLPQEQRDDYRERAVFGLNHPSVHFVPYLLGDTDHFADIVSRGGEGLIYRNMNAPYMQREGANRPANHWFKLKSVKDYDVVVTGYTDAEPGKFFGMIGAIRYGMYKDNNLIQIGKCSGMADVVRRHVTDHKEDFMGMVMEVRAAGQDEKSGALIEPRFIRWRYDKLPKSCIWE